MYECFLDISIKCVGAGYGTRCFSINAAAWEIIKHGRGKIRIPEFAGDKIKV